MPCDPCYYYLIVADKEGGFVVMPQGMFQKKAREAVLKNFKPIDFCAKKQRKQAIGLLKKMNLQAIALSVSKAERDSLDVFHWKNAQGGMPSSSNCV